jgi:hypothetical protein
MKLNASIILVALQTVVQLSVFGMGAGDPVRNLRRAINDGATARFTFKITDHEGNAVSNANVSAGFVMLNKKSNRVIGSTDSNGVFAAESVAQWEVGARMGKLGFYDSTWGMFLAKDEQSVSNGCWLPWNPTIPVVLREIRKPIPMYVKYFEGKFPNGVPVGFDCEIGDLVEPHGQGKVADFTILSHVGGIMYKKTVKDISLSSQDPDEGFRIEKLHVDSAFKSDYFAPEFGYATNLFAASSYDSSGPGFQGTILYGGDSYLVFKSRVKRDSDGNIISANYGKIYNEITYGGSDPSMKTTGVKFLYYFNPTPNDRNLEFDGRNNLFKPGWNSNLNWSREP